MLSLILGTLVALALPPSSVLAGPEGQLVWIVETTADGVAITGSSPSWTVRHVARADLTPVRTERIDTTGRYVVDYDAEGAALDGPSGPRRIRRTGLWDGETLDVRLGRLVARGVETVRFEAIDVKSGKVYAFEARYGARERCGALSCTPVVVQLTGVLRLVGPTWRYWYAPDGRLVRFEGPAGRFVADDAAGGAP